MSLWYKYANNENKGNTVKVHNNDVILIYQITDQEGLKDVQHDRYWCSTCMQSDNTIIATLDCTLLNLYILYLYLYKICHVTIFLNYFFNGFLDFC